MIKPIVNTLTVFLLLTAINLVFLFVIKTYKKFYSGQVILFVLVLGLILAWHNFIFPHLINNIEAERNADANKHSGQVSNEVWLTTKHTEDLLYSLNRPAFEAVVFQTTITFMFSLIGLQRTNEKKLFTRISIIFGIFSLILWLIYLTASIAPTGVVT